MKYRIREQNELKPSGVEWLGDIPKDWEYHKNKYIFKRISNNVGDNYDNYKVLSLTLNGVIERNMNNMGKMPSSFSIYQIVEKDSLILCLFDIDVTPRIIGYVNTQGIISSAYTNLIVKNLYSKYYYYWFLTLNNQNILLNYTKSLRNTINNENFMSLESLVCSFFEQQKIANFLDEKSKIFDEAILKKEQLISKLELAKQSLISEVVTGKLKIVEENSKLQTIKREQNELKASGVEWLCDIPKDWQVKKLKYFTKLNPNKFNLDEKIKDDIEVSFVPMENIRRGNINLENSKNINSVINGYTFFEENDILIAKVTPCFENHNCAIAKNLKNEIGFGSTELNVLRCFNKDSIKFVYYYIQTDLFINLGVSQMTGTGGLKRVPSSFFENFKISFPTITEQQKISKYLDEKLIHFDNTIEKTKQSITKLKEAKEALISQTVTGKIEVL
ncbi:MAG: restriction endonuclease subunit S [Arcobacter sp.]|uniref:restriction endonuclease subunit S n=1 Tax=Arcobacter sp. TaxID=1872629 RepID=UPI003D027F9B